MSNPTDKIAPDTARMVIQFQRARDGSEQYQWGIVGTIPILTLIGQICHVQAELTDSEWIPEWEGDKALVVVWDAVDKTMSHYKHPDIPPDSLLGMLEIIKIALVSSRIAQHNAANQVILGPDGRPIMA